MQVFSKERCENRWNHRGMTVIEVLIVIVLMAVVLAPAVNALSTTTKIWSHNSAINPCISQANASMLWISREIRGATRPSSTVDSVLVEDGGQEGVLSGDDHSGACEVLEVFPGGGGAVRSGRHLEDERFGVGVTREMHTVAAIDGPPSQVRVERIVAELGQGRLVAVLVVHLGSGGE